MIWLSQFFVIPLHPTMSHKNGWWLKVGSSLKAIHSRLKNWERSQNSRTPISDLNINELPLNKKEIGNTLETRGLTYSYTFLTKPKNAHLGCKGTKLIWHNQILFVNSGLLIGFHLLILHMPKAPLHAIIITFCLWISFVCFVNPTSQSPNIFYQ